MALTLKNYATELSKELLKHAAKVTVRECDETEKGHFVAYVDEGAETYDVSLVLSSKGEVLEHGCECKNRNHFCAHKAALLVHIAQGKRPKAAIKGKKKQASWEALLEDADPLELKEWVKDLLQKNKDVEFLFTQHFLSGQRQYTPEEVTKLTNDAIRVVAGNKRTLDPTQVKKLVELWTDIHAPIVKYYQAAVDDKTLFMNFHTVLECCDAFATKIYTTSTRIGKYIEALLQQTVESINNLENEQAWDKAVVYYIDSLMDKKRDIIRLRYLVHLQHVIAVSNEVRKTKLIDRLAEQFGNSEPDFSIVGSEYIRQMFDIIEAAGALPRYYSYFKPIYFDNEYSLKYLNGLIAIGELEVAESYCVKQVEGNYRGEYNTPYLELLKEIYTLQGDEGKRASVLAQLFPATFDYEDYQYIYDRMPEGEAKKKWRTKILAKARNAALNHNRKASSFLFRLFDAEQNYRKMINEIDSATPYAEILRYFEPMIRADKNELLKAIFNKYDSWFYNTENVAEEETVFPELYDIIEKHYSSKALLELVSQRQRGGFYHSPNRFFTYMKNRLFVHKGGRLNEYDNEIM